MVDKRNDAFVIAQARAAVYRDVLPGLEIAWDRAGPMTLLIAELLIADLWVAEGNPPDVLLEGLKTYLGSVLPVLKEA